MKKYELTSESITVNGRKLFRIKALRDFSSIKAGDLGGFIEIEDNLNHAGSAWIFGNAWVYDNAKVSGDAWVYGYARVYDNAIVCGNAAVYDNAEVYGNAKVFNNAKVYNNAKVRRDARVTITPIVLDLTYTITITDNNICIGCQVYDFKTWKRIYKKIAKNHGMPAKLRNEYFGIIKRLYNFHMEKLKKG